MLSDINFLHFDELEMRSMQIAPFRYWKNILENLGCLDVIVLVKLWKGLKARIFPLLLIQIRLLETSVLIIKCSFHSKVLSFFSIFGYFAFAVKGVFFTFTCLPSNVQVLTCLFQSLRFKETMVPYLILMFVQMFIFNILASWKWFLHIAPFHYWRNKLNSSWCLEVSICLEIWNI